VHRDFAASRPTQTRGRALTELTAELEWLFNITNRVEGATDDRRILKGLLRSAADRLECGYAVICIPEKRLLMEHERDALMAASLKAAGRQTQQHLLAWATRQQKPLMISNGVGTRKKAATCKILSVPVQRYTGRVLGVLVFFNPPSGADFITRHEFLARRG